MWTLPAVAPAVAVVVVVAVAAAAAVVAKMAHQDLIGLGWRKELAAGIFAHMDQIDVLEVIADDYYNATTAQRSSLQLLASQIPLSLHGVSLGMVSQFGVSVDKLEKLKYLMDEIRPLSWSEHLSFVRAGGHEIGHLAAPPYHPDWIEAALRNIEKAKQIVGCVPHLENIATLIKPPLSIMTEAEFTTEIVSRAGSGFLLDLHNLYANALNSGHEPLDYLKQFPLHLTTQIHLSGGHWIPEPTNEGRQRLLDDHVHDVPEALYDLLEQVAQQTPHDLVVIIERDGKFPPFEILLGQIAKARSAVQRGRLRKVRSHEFQML